MSSNRCLQRSYLHRFTLPRHATVKSIYIDLRLRAGTVAALTIDVKPIDRKSIEFASIGQIDSIYGLIDLEAATTASNVKSISAT